MPPKLTKSETKIREVRRRAAKRFEGQFLDTWFLLRPSSYNKFFDLHNGDGAATIKDFSFTSPGSFRLTRANAALRATSPGAFR